MSSERGPAVGVAILTYQGYAVARRCIESLALLEQWPLPTIVIDNASGTQEAERLAADLGSPVEALTRTVNDGVGGGYNAGLAWGIREGFDHVLLLNYDVVVSDPMMLTRLLDAASPYGGAVGPVVLDPDGSTWSCGGFVDWRHGLAGHLRLPSQTAPYEVDWLDGPCLLVALDNLGRIGGLETLFFMYYEDADWGIRAKRAGLPCRIQPSTLIAHDRGGRSPSRSLLRRIARNRMLFMRRNASGKENVYWLAWMILWETPRSLWRSRREPRIVVHVVVDLVAAFAWNGFDAIRARRWRVPASGPTVPGS